MDLMRLRQSAGIRALMSETQVSASQLVMPLFIHEGISEPRPVAAMPGVFQHSVDSVVDEVAELVGLGIRAVLLFGIPVEKTPTADAAFNPNGGVQQVISVLKQKFPELVVMADCCLCEYSADGHCGPRDSAGNIDLEKTLIILEKVALSYAKAGVDIVAPSGMMDGMIARLRSALDQNGFSRTLLMSYAVKYASAFYGPFREAAGSGDHFVGHRKDHQMNPAQIREAFREAQADVDQGADILMVKPGLPYLDVLAQLRQRHDLPLAVYQVSGEYAMIKAAAAAGALDERAAIQETLTAFRRAGADLIITYFAKDYARL